MPFRSNFPEFDKALRRYIKRLPEDLVLPFTKKVALDAFTRIVHRTPVDTGRARANWQISPGSPSLRDDAAANPDASSAVTNQVGELARAKPFETIWISNNLPYIEALEDGWSQQAPSGMVAITVREILEAFK